MEFEFERRRVTKEEIRELIFREILEYHPQLLKDYMNGTERTNFLYPRFLISWLHFHCLCHVIFFPPYMFFSPYLFFGAFPYSAVDQFRKQFAHLEENGKNGPVMPLDRKHVSLPR